MKIESLAVIMIAGCSAGTQLPTSECTSEYSGVIISDLTRGKYVTSVPATYKGENFRVVIDSFELSKLLKQSHQVPDSLSVYNVLSGISPLQLSVDNIDEVAIVRRWREIDCVLEKGKDYSLKYFFEGNMQKVQLSYSERNRLIDALVGWCVLVYIDDESGKIKVLELTEYKKMPHRP
jgi:hypothetical protein